jgi:hypothetical protein
MVSILGKRIRVGNLVDTSAAIKTCSRCDF